MTFSSNCATNLTTDISVKNKIILSKHPFWLWKTKINTKLSTKNIKQIQKLSFLTSIKSSKKNSLTTNKSIQKH